MIAVFAALALCADPVARIAAEAQGRVGAAAAILEGGPIFEYHGSQHFPMQSVYKLPIAMAALAEVDQGKLRLDQKVHVDPSAFVGKSYHSPLRDNNPGGADVPLSVLLRLAVVESDGTASDVVMRLAGGPGAVMKFLADIGVREITVRDTEFRFSHDDSLQYKNWATPMGAIGLLKTVQQSRGLSASSHALLMKFLIENVSAPHRIKGLLPPGTVVAHKTGTSGTHDGFTAATNDIGIATLPDGRHLAIAVFVSDSKADAETRERVIAEIARQAWDRATRAKTP